MPHPYRSYREFLDDEEALGNVLRIRAPIRCGDYDEIVEIGNGVPGKQPRTEVRATVRYLHTLPGKPIGILENPVNNRPDVPVVLNPWPSRERVLRGLGLPHKDALCEKIDGLKNGKIKPVTVPHSAAPCKEVVINRDELDLRRDIPRNWVEFNQVLWSTCNGTIVVYDPETGHHDLGKVRLGQYEWRDANPVQPFPEEKVRREMFATLIYAGQVASNAGLYYLKNYKQKNRPMPAAFIYGVTADVHVTAGLRIFRWPVDGDEYEVVSSMRGEPIELVPSETIPGLMVPATAEWVIEGEFMLEDEIMPLPISVRRGHRLGLPLRQRELPRLQGELHHPPPGCVLGRYHLLFVRIQRCRRQRRQPRGAPYRAPVPQRGTRRAELPAGAGV